MRHESRADGSRSGVEDTYLWDVANATEMGRYLTDIEGRFIQSCLAAAGPKTLVDVGGGSGRFAIPLQRTGYRVMVTDIDPVPLRILKRKAPQVGAIRSGHPDRRLQFLDGSVDGILCIEVPFLVHYRVAQWFLRECHRIARPHGVLIVAAQNRCSYKGVMKKLLLRFDGRGREGQSSEYSTSVVELRRSLGKAGFDVVAEEGFNWVPAARVSESRAIRVAAGVERYLRLRRSSP